MSTERADDKESGLPHHETSSSTVQSEKRPLRHTLRKELTAFIGEFIGTFMFLALAFCGTQIAINSTAAAPTLDSDSPSAPNVNKLLYIAFAFGLSLAINVAIFADVSGGKFNPAVSFSPAAFVLPYLPTPHRATSLVDFPSGPQEIVCNAD
jgi:aquaporin related protein